MQLEKLSQTETQNQELLAETARLDKVGCARTHGYAIDGDISYSGLEIAAAGR